MGGGDLGLARRAGEDEIVAVDDGGAANQRDGTGWQPHTVRGAFAGALKKKLGLTVTSEKVEGTRVYRFA
jgi:hypothetical protein